MLVLSPDQSARRRTLGVCASCAGARSCSRGTSSSMTRSMPACGSSRVEPRCMSLPPTATHGSTPAASARSAGMGVRDSSAGGRACRRRARGATGAGGGELATRAGARRPRARRRSSGARTSAALRRCRAAGQRAGAAGRRRRRDALGLGRRVAVRGGRGAARREDGARVQQHRAGQPRRRQQRQRVCGASPRPRRHGELSFVCVCRGAGLR
jgi:hypothetical protein